MTRISLKRGISLPAFDLPATAGDALAWDEERHRRPLCRRGAHAATERHRDGDGDGGAARADGRPRCAGGCAGAPGGEGARRAAAA